MKDIISMYINLSSHGDGFIEAVVRDGRSYSSALLSRARTVLA